jgi:CRISPR/Cas system CSM-associated protein Csm3 (group 7 of RAMP superfamily)
MKTQYFKCKLLSDIVVNASLATEGNMTTLDYIPGSNFLGIAASSLYKQKELSKDILYEIFHSGKVSFGDALISKNDHLSYAVPFSLFQDKLEKGLGESDKKVWVHHLLDDTKPKNENGDFRQLKQQRGGYLNSNKDYIKIVEKQFSLKSAHSRDERRSAEGKMFGFESIKKGQEFVFSVKIEDEKYYEIVSEALIGNRRIGKSKTAQYGQVNISKIENVKPFRNGDFENNQLVIYAESNLCFFNEFGQSTFQPEIKEFGNFKGTINWNLSQIRTYSYSPWNGIRNTTNTQRDVMQKGSVIIVDGFNGNVDDLNTQVGEYTSEGLGRVIYNPEFLKADEEGVWNFELHKKPENEAGEKPIDLNDIKTTTRIGGFLHNKLKMEDQEKAIGKAVIDIIKSNTVLNDNKISPSQWGAIRTKAANAGSVDTLISELFEPKTGYLMHGVADEKIWGVKGGKRSNTLQEIINVNRSLGTKFVARLAADMAKLNTGKEGKK